MTWGIYQMTNLYNRGALMEFFAQGLLTSGFAFLIQAMRAEDRSVTRATTRAAVCYALAAAHPLTGLYGGVFLAVFATGACVAARDPRRLARDLVLHAVGIAAILSPWAYIVGRFRGELTVAQSMQSVRFLANDRLRERLWPLPHDSRMAGPVTEIPTPYLETGCRVRCSRSIRDRR